MSKLSSREIRTSENNVETLQNIFEDRDVAGEEDEGDGRSKGNGGDARVLPLEIVRNELFDLIDILRTLRML